ncbi:MAG TPA: RCC1 domain-containing protein [Nannocystaceae bacterium]|nr:RCC1 domain-containing protein [Nannocystaceae bacterium]
MVCARRLALALFACTACSGATQPEGVTADPAPPAAVAMPSVDAECGAPGSTTPPAAVARITTTSLQSCAELVDGSVWCWGARGTTQIDGCVFGSLACPIATRTRERPAAAPIEPITFFGVGCTLVGGTVTCGDGERNLILGTDIAAIVGARGRLLAIRDDGTPLRFDACNGRLCEELLAPQLESTAVAIVHANPQTCILGRDGHVWCEQPCRSPRCEEFVEVAGVDDATQLAVSSDHACVVRRDGSVVCWGESSCGQAGGSSERGRPCSGRRMVEPSTISWAQ